MFEKFKVQLKKDGRSFKWFVKKYLAGDVSYVYASMQLNGNATVQKPLEDAVWKYMKENA